MTKQIILAGPLHLPEGCDASIIRKRLQRIGGNLVSTGTNVEIRVQAARPLISPPSDDSSLRPQGTIAYHAATYHQDTVLAGRAAWEALHRKRGMTREWLYEVWLPTVPSFHCSCQSEARQYLDTNPPPYGAEDGCFAWGVDLHNWVNAKLHKPPVSLAEAKTLWDRKDGG